MIEDREEQSARTLISRKYEEQSAETLISGSDEEEQSAETIISRTDGEQSAEAVIFRENREGQSAETLIFRKDVEEQSVETLISQIDGEEQSVETLLSCAQCLVPLAVKRAKEVKSFVVRWKIIISKLDQIPPRLTDLSTHPFFSKSSLCKETILSVTSTLKDSIRLADSCIGKIYDGKLQMQSDLDSMAGQLDSILRDLGFLINGRDLSGCRIAELFARLQIGDLEKKRRALDKLLELIINGKASTVAENFIKSDVGALINLLISSASPIVKAKTISIICLLVGNGKDWIVSEGAIPPLIKLVESGTMVCKEKALMMLQKLSESSETALHIAGHGVILGLLNACGDSALQIIASCTLKNLSYVPELRRTLAENGAIKTMLDVINQDDKSTVEHAVICLRNIVFSKQEEKYPDLLPTLIRVLKAGTLTLAAREASASAISKICVGNSSMKISAGEAIPALIELLEAKNSGTREAAAEAIWILIEIPANRKTVMKDWRSVPNLVQLLEPCRVNYGAQKYGVLCLESISESGRCRKMMISYGAIGYLKKMVEMEVAGARKLEKKLGRGRIRRILFGYSHRS